MPEKSSTAPDRTHERTIHKRTRDELLAESPGTLQPVGIAADHGGDELKESLAGKLREAGHEVVHFGDGRPKEDDDYPDFIVPLARAVAAGTGKRRIGICGSGVGASVCAYEVAGVRACLIQENFSAPQGVEDGDLNRIGFGGLVVGRALAWELVQTGADISRRAVHRRGSLSSSGKNNGTRKNAMSTEQKWAELRFGAVKVETRDGKHIMEVPVSLHGLDPNAARVELYAGGVKENHPVRQEMTCLHPLADESGGNVYSATVSAARPPADYTARVMPHCDGVAIPLEHSRIPWQR